MKVVSTATATSAVRALSTGRGLGVAPGAGGASLVHSSASGNAHTRWLGRRNGGGMMMCSAGAPATAADAAFEVSAEGLEIGASIKSKGDTIRDLKAGGASKDDLKPHIEV